MRTIGIIPARGGSKSVIKKNIKPLNGKPLIYYTIEAALKSNLTKVLVSTDDPEIKLVAEQFNVQVLNRPAYLGQDSTPTHDVIINCLENINDTYDAVMILQPTSPFRKAEHIDECIQLFEKDVAANSLVSIQRVPHNMVPNSLMIKKNGYLEHLTKEPRVYRRQDKSEYFARNGAAIYLTRYKDVFQYIIGGKIMYYEMPKLASIDIDDIEDFEIAQLLFKGSAQ